MSKSKPEPEPERHSMRGWGLKFADWAEPRTLEEAQVMAQLATADRLLECMSSLEDIKLRLARLERYMDECVPGYREAHAHPGHDVPMLQAIAGVRIQ